MKRWVIFALVVTAAWWIDPLLPNRAAAETVKDLEVGLSAGYRADELDWNIAGDINGENPNVLSDLTWEDLEIFQIKAKGEINVERKDFTYFTTYIRACVGYGWIVDGKNQDSDYLGDNRAFEFSRSNNGSDDGDVLDASVGAGPQFRVMSDRLAIIPLVGYSYHEQNLTMTDGVQTIPNYGPFSGLDSTYETQWDGPWLGIDLAFRPAENFTLKGSFEYHWADYKGEANWNLRTDLAHPKSFEHDADGDGVVLSFGGDYAFTNHLSIHLNLDYQDWKTDDGIDKTFLADGTVLVTRFNEVNWESYAVMLGMTYRFF